MSMGDTAWTKLQEKIDADNRTDSRNSSTTNTSKEETLYALDHWKAKQQLKQIKVEEEKRKKLIKKLTKELSKEIPAKYQGKELEKMKKEREQKTQILALLKQEETDAEAAKEAANRPILEEPTPEPEIEPGSEEEFEDVPPEPEEESGPNDYGFSYNKKPKGYRPPDEAPPQAAAASSKPPYLVAVPVQYAQHLDRMQWVYKEQAQQPHSQSSHHHNHHHH